MKREHILVEARELHQRIAADSWIAIDCRFDLGDVTAGRRSYEQAHIPGAVFLDLDADLAGPVGVGTGRHPLPDPDWLIAMLGHRGIRQSDNVVVYDSSHGAVAARAWWMFRWLGLQSVRLLNGGWAHWLEQGLPVESDAVHRKPVEFTGSANHALVLTTAELAGDPALIPARNLLDARDRGRFRGEHEPIDPVAGHIPGAVNVPFSGFVDQDGRWRSLGDRTRLLEGALGSDREVDWSVMCGSGVTACHLAISGLEAGFREPRLYVGSWSEWIQDPDRPIGAGKG